MVLLELKNILENYKTAAFDLNTMKDKEALDTFFKRMGHEEFLAAKEFLDHLKTIPKEDTHRIHRIWKEFRIEYAFSPHIRNSINYVMKGKQPISYVDASDLRPFLASKVVERELLKRMGRENEFDDETYYNAFYRYMVATGDNDITYKDKHFKDVFIAPDKTAQEITKHVLRNKEEIYKKHYEPHTKKIPEKITKENMSKYFNILGTEKSDKLPTEKIIGKS